jgi:hypothetical protein
MEVIQKIHRRSGCESTYFETEKVDILRTFSARSPQRGFSLCCEVFFVGFWLADGPDIEEIESSYGKRCKERTAAPGQSPLVDWGKKI